MGTPAAWTRSEALDDSVSYRMQRICATGAGTNWGGYFSGGVGVGPIGSEKVTLLNGMNNHGIVKTLGSNGSINTLLSTLVGTPDLGSVSVHDSSGTFRAAIYVDGSGLGVVDADMATAGAKAFKIDHPLDPANKYLYHSVVESPDMMNVYNGNVITDANGQASVELPAYFQALNRDFRYQLTVIGQFAQAIVDRKVENNRFSIRTDKPNVEVSWQVTGVRQDAFANARRVQVEVDKTGPEQGRYLHPELFGQPPEMHVPSKVAQAKAHEPVGLDSELQDPLGSMERRNGNR